MPVKLGLEFICEDVYNRGKRIYEHEKGQMLFPEASTLASTIRRCAREHFPLQPSDVIINAFSDYVNNFRCS